MAVRTPALAMAEGVVGDFYWDYCDILRGAYGVSESLYDQRVLAFMALKLLCDNGRLTFSFDPSRNFDQTTFKGKSAKETFLQIVRNLEKFDRTSDSFRQAQSLNDPESTLDTVESCLKYLNTPETFDLTAYVNELSDEHLQMVLSVYRNKADFRGYPREGYKDLYEQTVWRMRNSGKRSISGQLTGQHFTQRSIIELMCKASLGKVKKRQRICIYDPTCGVGSMLMESYFIFSEERPDSSIEVYGQELSPQVWMLAKIFLEVAEIPNQIARGNTLTQPAFAGGINSADSFDFIIANPPFGVDWKHSYDKVVADVAADGRSLWVPPGVTEPPLPRRSDGQFLFMLHIVQLMTRSRAKGKSAHAAVITSGSLLSVGGAESGEARIRRALFEHDLVSCVLEQPPGMFTNTDIVTHVWFLDATDRRRNPWPGFVKLVRANNGVEPLFSPHPAPKDKMKNGYSAVDIQRLAEEVVGKTETIALSKFAATPDVSGFSMQKEVPAPSDSKGPSLFELEDSMKTLVRLLAETTGVLA